MTEKNVRRIVGIFALAVCISTFAFAETARRECRDAVSKFKGAKVDFEKGISACTRALQ
jgi:hypothetical protein